MFYIVFKQCKVAVRRCKICASSYGHLKALYRVLMAFLVIVQAAEVVRSFEVSVVIFDSVFEYGYILYPVGEATVRGIRKRIFKIRLVTAVKCAVIIKKRKRLIAEIKQLKCLFIETAEPQFKR